MQRTTILTMALAVLALEHPARVPAAETETFQAEAGLSYSRFKSGDVRDNTAGVEASYFFDKLPTRPKDYPLEQAQFVERSGSLGASYSRSSTDITGQERLSDSSLYGVNVDFRRPNSPLIISAGYHSFNSGKTRNPSASIEAEADTRFYQASVGAYVDKTTALALDWSRSKTDVKFNGSPIATDRFTSFGLSGQHLMRLAGGDHIAFVAAASQVTADLEGQLSSEKNRQYLLRMTYYPTRMLGITAGILSDRGDATFSEGETYMAGVKMFVTPTVSLSLDYQRFLAKEPNNNDDFVMLKGLVRF